MTDTAPMDRLAEAILSGKAPATARSAAARGALPLPRGLLVQLHVFLLEDPEEEIRKAARASLEALDKNQIRSVLADTNCAAPVLTYFTKPACRDEALAEPIVFHAATPPAALLALAASGNAPVLDLMLTNQERLLKQQGLLEQLMSNPGLRADQRGRILELLERASKMMETGGVGADGAPEAGSETAESAEEAARLLDVDVGELFSASEILDPEEFETSEDPAIRSAFQLIVTLNLAQKAILAMKGGREERSILIRDSNKLVAMAVLKNPRLNDNEIEAIAHMRNVTDEVLRQVGTTREWTKAYSVVKALVNNPKTPQHVSMSFISRLTNRDLREIGRSREIPELIRRMAKKTFDVRTQSQAGALRKKH